MTVNRHPRLLVLSWMVKLNGLKLIRIHGNPLHWVAHSSVFSSTEYLRHAKQNGVEWKIDFVEL